MGLFDNIKNAFIFDAAERHKRTAEELVMKDLKFAIKVIEKVGGSDSFCDAIIEKMSRDKDMMRRLTSGLVTEEEIEVPRTMVAYGALNSLMAALKDIAHGDSSEDTRMRLLAAETIFLSSWMIVDTGKTFASTQEAANWAQARRIEGDKALEQWRASDPATFRILAKV